MKIIYPALFHKEEELYWVEFPDLEGCQSFGDNIEEVYLNAKEALEAYCITILEEQQKLPPPGDIKKLEIDENSFTTLIEANLISKNKSVKKTLTIPGWLNDIAIEQHINFSYILQKALKEELKIGQ